MHLFKGVSLCAKPATKRVLRASLIVASLFNLPSVLLLPCFAILSGSYLWTSANEKRKRNVANRDINTIHAHKNAVTRTHTVRHVPPSIPRRTLACAFATPQPASFPAQPALVPPSPLLSNARKPRSTVMRLSPSQLSTTPTQRRPTPPSPGIVARPPCAKPAPCALSSR